MSIKLRQLIRNVRACKTAAEERSVIKNESALIRTSFRDNQDDMRARNVAKLLYADMLGYPSHFGQMECIKLIASPIFADKRVGYLALMLMLQEKDEVLMLATNSLKVDLNSNNKLIASLALTALGNLGTPDMCRDLAPEVDRHLRESSPLLRKHAALCTARILTKCPELIDDFVERIISLLKDKSHSVLLTGVQLMIHVLKLDPSHTSSFARLVPSLVRIQRNLLTSGFSVEHDVSGTTDPFLQVKILRMLCYLGKHSSEAVEGMSDVLTQVATNTETTKNAGNAVLYECVGTIMATDCESGLKLLGINILGRFLLNRDNNMRYVALTTLGKVVMDDVAAVQRHRATIVACLRDPDVSIRTRALELILQLVNETNVEELTMELLSYLAVAHPEQRRDLASEILRVVENFAPSKVWRIDTLITMLSLVGTNCDASIPAAAIIYTSQTPELHAWATHKTLRLLQDDLSQPSLTLLGVWCIGEYGELLLQPCGPAPGAVGATSYNAVSPAEVFDLIHKIMRDHNSSQVTKGYVLVALAKLAPRFGGEHTDRLKKMVESYQESMSLELQARSCEFSQLMAPSLASIQGQMLEKMPVLDEDAMREKRARFQESEAASDLVDSPPVPRSRQKVPPRNSSAPVTSGEAPNLLDLNDVLDSGSSQQAAAMAPSMDLLADIFSASATVSEPRVPLASAASSAAGPAVSQNHTFVALEKGGLRVTFELAKPSPLDPSVTQVTIHFQNPTGQQISGLHFQAAVPKYISMVLQPASGDALPGGSIGTVSQVLRLTNSQQGQKNIMLKMKLEFSSNGNQIQELVSVNGFPELY